MNCNASKPTEIHRSIRALDCLNHWKALEFRTFLLYTGIVVLKDHLSVEAYQNFLYLFCATTIFSSAQYLKTINFFNVAKCLLYDYVEQFINLYGLDTISSNVHNLIHVSEDVERFGPLTNLFTYPFENSLGHTKSLLRHGNRPLAQVAKRLIETEHSEIMKPKNEKKEQFPKLSNQLNTMHQLNGCENTFETITFDGFVLKNTEHDKWFMTKNNWVVQMINVTRLENIVYIYGARVSKLENFFDTPFESKHINVFCAANKQEKPQLFKLTDIKCKIFCLNYSNRLVFVPLLHTLDLMSK